MDEVCCSVVCVGEGAVLLYSGGNEGVVEWWEWMKWCSNVERRKEQSGISQRDRRL